jgi:hypothetical protein
MKTPRSTGKKPARKSGPPLPKFMQSSNIPPRDEDFYGEEKVMVEKLRGRSVAELRGLLTSLQGKYKSRLQMLIIREILAAQRGPRD